MTQLHGEDARVHARLVAVGKARRRIDAEEARWLMEAVRIRLHLKVGLGSMVQYAVDVLRHDTRTAQERVRTATALLDLPLLAAELCEGRTCWSAARELSRVCTAETEPRWVSATMGKSVREIEQACSGRRPGDLPDSPRDPRERTFTVTVELTAEQYARYRAAKEFAAKSRAAEPVATDEAALLDTICEAYLAPQPAAKPTVSRTTLLSMEQCPDCAQGWDISSGTKIQLDLAAIERRICDPKAVFGAHVGAGAMEIPAATRRAVIARDRHRCQVPGCNNHRYLEIHHILHLAHGGTHDLWNLILLCTAHHGAHHAGLLEITGRAGLDIQFRVLDPTPSWAAKISDRMAGELAALA